MVYNIVDKTEITEFVAILHVKLHNTVMIIHFFYCLKEIVLQY